VIPSGCCTETAAGGRRRLWLPDATPCNAAAHSTHAGDAQGGAANTKAPRPNHTHGGGPMPPGLLLAHMAQDSSSWCLPSRRCCTWVHKGGDPRLGAPPPTQGPRRQRLAVAQPSLLQQPNAFCSHQRHKHLALSPDMCTCWCDNCAAVLHLPIATAAEGYQLVAKCVVCVVLLLPMKARGLPGGLTGSRLLPRWHSPCCCPPCQTCPGAVQRVVHCTAQQRHVQRSWLLTTGAVVLHRLSAQLPERC
jgi:hypothetical protein